MTGQHVIALCGGIGGAKLARGLYELIGPDLTVIVNTGDDFEHLGLTISPDVDTVLYTLADLNDRERGWGRADETWNFMSALAEVGGETWFQLGDRDLALHVERTRRLREGHSLTRVVTDVARHFGISAKILPMSDDAVRTIVMADDGPLPFQKYFVGLGCAPVVRAIAFEGANGARVSPDVAAAFERRDLAAIVICPSNPYLSVDPILAVPGMRELLQRAGAPTIAVSPIIGGAAIKGPTTKIMAELKIEATNASIARHYAGIIDGLIVDRVDAADAASPPVATLTTATLMTSLEDRVNLARDVLDFARRLTASSEPAPRQHGFWMKQQRSIWAVVPVKSFARAKARLAALIDSAQREQLARAMLEDVLAGLREVEELSGIVVVSADRGAKEMARTHGARAIDDPVENGPNEAVRLALPFLRDMQADAMVVVPSDVPQIEPDELLPIIAKLQSPSVALVAAARDRGTNLFGCAPIDLIAPCFGPSSFAEHENAARRAGVKASVFACPSLMNDIDQPQDLTGFRVRYQTKTGACLAEWFGQTQMLGAAALAQ